MKGSWAVRTIAFAAGAKIYNQDSSVAFDLLVLQEEPLKPRWGGEGDGGLGSLRTAKAGRGGLRPLRERCLGWSWAGTRGGSEGTEALRTHAVPKAPRSAPRSAPRPIPRSTEAQKGNENTQMLD